MDFRYDRKKFVSNSTTCERLANLQVDSFVISGGMFLAHGNWMSKKEGIWKQ
jgi:hypothetical protein